jgi:hypothetical protein
MANQIVTPPNPEPIPPTDDDDGQLHWANFPDAPGGRKLITYALGNGDMGGTGLQGSCYTGLFAASQDFSIPFAAGSTNRVGRQLARFYESTGGGGPFMTEMLSPEKEVVVCPVASTIPRGNPVQEKQLYSAILTQRQYDSLRAEGDTSFLAQGPINFASDTELHDVLTFVPTPTFTIAGPLASVSGALTARDSVMLSGRSVPIQWVSIKVSLVGIVGMVNVDGVIVPTSWAKSDDAKAVGPVWEFDVLNGSGVCSSPNMAVHAVGWGLFKADLGAGQKTYAAVTPPMNVDGTCRLPGLESRDGALRDGIFPGTGSQPPVQAMYQAITPTHQQQAGKSVKGDHQAAAIEAFHQAAQFRKPGRPVAVLPEFSKK